jgi:hypothetical protein
MAVQRDAGRIEIEHNPVRHRGVISDTYSSSLATIISPCWK